MKRVIALPMILMVSFVVGSSSAASAQSVALGASQGNQSQTQIFGNGNDPPSQSQKQKQTQTAVSGAISGSGASITTGGTTATDIQTRQFPVPGTEGFAYLPSYFGPATADVNWQTMKTIAKYKLDWTASDAEALIKGGKLKSKPKCFYGAMSERPAAGAIRVAVNGDSKLVDQGYMMVGTNDVWSKNVETTTQEVLGQAIMDGLKMGADVCLVTGEGAAVVLKAFGWGAGINNSVSVVTGTLGNVGNVSAAGIGVSSVEAGYRSKPWLQVLYFKSMAAAAPTLPPVSTAPPPAPLAPPPPTVAAPPAPPAAPTAAPPAKEEEPGFKAWRKTTLQ